MEAVNRQQLKVPSLHNKQLHSNPQQVPNRPVSTDKQPATSENPKGMPSAQQATTKQQTATIDVSKMDEVVLMPRLSDTMTEGVIAPGIKKLAIL